MSPYRKLELKFYPMLTAVLLLGVMLFRLWYVGSGILDLAPDEAYYWEWSRRLDWSYYDKGPLVAYLIAASTTLGGHTVFFVRLPAVLLALGAALFAYFLTKRLFASDRTAFLAVVVFSLMPLYAAGSILMTIDSPFMFFWALAIFALYKAVRDPQSASRDQKTPSSDLSVKACLRSGDAVHRMSNVAWWALFGIALGLGFLSKYTMLLLLPCLLLYLLRSSFARVWLRRKELYFALILGTLFMTPVVVWNAQHEWVSFLHILGLTGLTGGGMHFSAKNFFDFLGSQVGIVSPFLFLGLAGAMIRSGRLGLREGRDEHLFLFGFSAPVFAFFLLWSLYSKVYANWAAPAYFTAAIALAGWGEELIQRIHEPKRRRALAVAFSLILLPGILVVAGGHFPTLVDLAGIDLPRKLDPTWRLQGWSELGEAVGKVLHKGEGKEPPAIVSKRYQIASELAFYVPGHPRVFSVNRQGTRLNQYDIWGGLETLTGRDLLFVAYERDKHCVRTASGMTCGAPYEIHGACEEIEEVGAVRTFYRGRPGRTFSLFYCRNLREFSVQQREINY